MLNSNNEIKIDGSNNKVYIGAKEKFEPMLDWLRTKMLLQIDNAGKRYSPKLNVRNDFFYDLVNIEKPELLLNKLKSRIVDSRFKYSYPYFKEAFDEKAITIYCDSIVEYFPKEDIPEMLKIPEYINDFFNIAEQALDDITILYENQKIKNLLGKILLISDTMSKFLTTEAYQNLREKNRHKDDICQRFVSVVSELRDIMITPYKKAFSYATISSNESSIELISDFQLYRIALTKTLLITGEALIGKTHLLCDTTVNRLNHDLPTLIFFGQEFTPDKSIISTMINSLGIVNSDEDEFLEALNNLGLEYNTKTLIIVDAINETKGSCLWQDGIIGFCNKVKSYSHLAIVLSIRDVEKNCLITNHNEEFIQKQMVEVEHKGFEGIEIEAVQTFCNALGVEFPKVPLHTNRLFVNPGMLFLYIEIIKKTTKKFDTSIINPTTIFKAYIDKLNRDFSQKYNVDEDDRTVEEAINIFISLGAQQDYTHFYLPQKIVSRELKILHVNVLEFLKSEGVLNKLNTDNEIKLYFTYQKFENFFIAEYLLNDFEKNKSIIFDLIKGYNGAITEALLMQIPEKLSKDIFDLNVWLIRDKYICEQYITSLVWRNPSTINDDTFKYLNFLLPWHDLYDNYLDTVLQLSSIPNHPLNIERLHKRLLKFSIAERDYNWSIYIHNSFIDDGIVKRIMNWAWDKNTDFEINDESLYLYGLMLGWFLTSSNRVLRDGATKAIVNLFTDKVDVFLKVLQAFEDVDDLYVLERLYAIGYGITLRSSMHSGFEALAFYIYKTVFAVEHVVDHILLRDYATSTVEYINSIIPLDLDISKVLPPYNQNTSWEIPQIEESEVEKYHDDFLMMYSSSLEGDFQSHRVRYAISDFLNLKIANRPHGKSPKQRCEDFFDSLTDEQNKIYHTTLISPDEGMKLLKNKTEYFEDSIQSLSPSFTDYRKTKIEKSGFLELLSLEQRKEFTEFILNYTASNYENNEIDYRSVERYIFLEAIRLGWDKELFYEFDRSMGTGRMHDESFERIGKKFQWISLHKVLAKLSDNYEFLDDNSHKRVDKYEGSYQVSVRDIDPTTILKSKQEEQEKWWFTQNLDFEYFELSDVLWMGSNKKLPTISSLVDVKKEEESYLLQSIQFHINSNKNEEKYRNLYYHIDAFVIEKNSVNSLVEWAKNNNLYGRDTKIPESHHFSEPYLREYPNSKAYNYIDIDYYGQTSWQTIEDTPFNVLLTSTAYFNEGKSYDKSVDESIEIALPNKWFIEQMKLKQTLNDGEWIDPNGQVVFFDPTVKSCCVSQYNENSVLLANKNLLVEFLEKENLTLFWIMWGEKQVRNEGGNYNREKFLGIAEIESISHWDGSKIIDEPIKIKFEKRN